jgi:hypothetical protein
MTGKGGFWRKVAGAFVEFEEGPTAPRPPAPPPSIEAELASTEKLLQELSAGRSAPSSAFPPPATPTPAASAPPPASAPPAASAPPPASAAGPGAELPAGASFADLYTAAKIAPVHHTAEQLLAILDGLAAMPPDACRLAVQAMDAADDRWTVADVLHDARAKIEVLAKAAGDLAQRGQHATDKARADQALVDSQLAEAETTIQQQIAQLQAELESFRAEAAQQHAQIEADLSAARDVVSRETTRVQGEIARLGRVRAFLEPIVGAPPSTPSR